MTKLQNVGGYGILAIPTLPAIIVFFHAIRGTLGGALVSSAPTELRVPSHRFHGFTQNFLTPPIICAHLCNLWEKTTARNFCVFCEFCGKIRY